MKQISTRTKEKGLLSLLSMPGRRVGNNTVHSTISVNRPVPQSTPEHPRLNGSLILTIAKPETMASQAICGALDEIPGPALSTAL